MIRRLIILLFIVGCVFAREYIAIIDFEGINVSEGDAKALTQRLTSEMIKLEVYQALERSEMKRLLEEQKFQYSGCVDLNCAVELGKMIGAKYMVVGSISKVGNTYSIDSRLIDVKTSESYISANYDSSSEIDILMKEGMISIAHQLSELHFESNITETKTNNIIDKTSGKIPKPHTENIAYRDDTSNPEAFGKAVLNTLKNKNKNSWNNLITTENQFRLAISNSKLSLKYKKRFLGDIDSEDFQEDLMEAHLAFDEIIFDAENSDIILKNIIYDSVEYKVYDAENFLFSDIYLNLNYNGLLYTIWLDDCFKASDGWLMIDNPQWCTGQCGKKGNRKL